MPRRTDRDDYFSPGQQVLPVVEAGGSKPPVDDRQWACARCGGRQFKVDLTHTLFDPRLAPGRCAERINRKPCPGVLARLVSGS